jgi:hypothetical protein
MRKNNKPCKEESLEPIVADGKIVNQAAKNLCEKAEQVARSQLHPLLQIEKLENLDRKCEFLQAFKCALEEGLARQLASWQPCIQAVYQFNQSLPQTEDCWDSTIHLLVMVARPLHAMQALGPRLDHNIVRQLKRLNWPRFRESKSIVEIKQITPDEVRIGIGYGAMFSSVYNAPVRVWPQRKRG